MAAFQIVNGSRVDAVPVPRGPVEQGTPDLLVDGMNLTARLPRADVLALLRDLAHELVDLARGRRERATVRSSGADGPWELGIERSADAVLVSLFRAGARPEVVLFERPVPGSVLVAAVLSALDEAMLIPSSASLKREVELARSAVASAAWEARSEPSRVIVANVEPDEDDRVRITAE